MKATKNIDSRKQATEKAVRYAHRIKGLLMNLETLTETLVPTDQAEAGTLDWGTVGSLAHMEAELAGLLVGFNCGPDQDEAEVRAEILASVDPQAEASI